MSISLVIPTLNAAGEVGRLLDSLLAQTVVPDDILIIDSASDDNTLEIISEYPQVRTICISRSEFDHGGTRNMAISRTTGEFVLFLTQDALPANNRYVESMLRPFSDARVGMVTGRQIPKDDAKRYVQLVQEFNYPKVSSVRAKADIDALGIKAYFASDACSAYRRTALEAIGGIPNPCFTNEDMLAAERLLKADYLVAYTANACVLHSHNLSPIAQFSRNRAIGTFLKENSAELAIPSEVSEGRQLVTKVAAQLLRERRPIELAAFCVDCAARLFGNRVGRFFPIRK